MLIAFWILNGLLALVFLGAGLSKIFRPKEALYESGMKYTEDFSAAQVKLIGAVEVLGALGLVLPVLLTIAPVLAPIAAIGLAVVMIAATVVHVRRKEAPVPTLVLTVLAIASAIVGFIVVL